MFGLWESCSDTSLKTDAAKLDHHQIFYHRGKRECDFLILERGKIVSAIQVCRTLYSSDTRKREIEGLVEAMTFYGLQEGLILTENNEETIDAGDGTIRVVPIWMWLLGGNT